jgi:hypothetical protein
VNEGIDAADPAHLAGLNPVFNEATGQRPAMVEVHDIGQPRF